MIGISMDIQEFTNFSEYTKVFLGIIAVVSPPVFVPIFVGLVADRTAAEKKTVALVGALGFFITASFFALFGDVLLAAFSITLPTFRLAGGFLLLLIALDMLRADQSKQRAVETTQKASVMALAIVPLAIPILAGPGVMTAVVLFAASEEGWTHRFLIVLVLLFVAVCIYLILRIGALAGRAFSPNVTQIFNKVMGLLICAVAFEFMLDGISGHFPVLQSIH